MAVARNADVELFYESFGDPAFLTTPAPPSRAENVERHLAALAVYGSRPDWIDEAATRERAAAAYDRCFHPSGVARQFEAVLADGSRAEGLRNVAVPTLVMHGSRDTLIDPSGGRRTAELISGARYVEIEGMGHDYPSAVWEKWVDIWATFVTDAGAEASNPS